MTRSLSDAELAALYDGAFEMSGRSHATARRALYDAGRGLEPALPSRTEQARFLRARYDRIFEAVAARHGVTVDRMLAKHRGGYLVAAEVASHRELCWLLRNASGSVKQLGWTEIGRLVDRCHADVIRSCRMTEEMIVGRTGYRDELIGALGGAGERRAAR